MPAYASHHHLQDMDERPTLPSIHTLNLPSLRRHDNDYPRMKITHDRHVSTSSSATTSSSRSASPESPTHTMRTPRPRPSRLTPYTRPQPLQTPTKAQNTQFRLIPCALEDATALVITSHLPASVPLFMPTPVSSPVASSFPASVKNASSPPPRAYTSSTTSAILQSPADPAAAPSPPTSYTLPGGKQLGRGLLIMGEKVREIRSGRRTVAKGARVHPYRLALASDTKPTPTTSSYSSASASPSPSP